MAIGLVGKKCGMTRVFEADGASVPVTVIKVDPNRVTQVKTLETDGYASIQVTTGEAKVSRLSKGKSGHFAKAGVEAGRGLWEFRVDAEKVAEISVGDALNTDLFEVDAKVDVVGVSKGKGFAGAVKRWNFRTQDATHGNSLSHRAPGSIGQCQTPGRVFKGKKMAGQLGSKKVTVQSLRVVKVDSERGLILIKGAVPGATGNSVIVSPAVKS